MFKSRRLSVFCLILSVPLAFGGAVILFDQRHDDFPPALAPFAAGAFGLGLAGATAVAVRYWRSFHYRQLQGLFLRQADGSYLARHVRPVRGGPTDTDFYVIDEATKERALNFLVNIATADTALLVGMIFGTVISLVLWSSGLIVAILAVLVFGARFALGRWSRAPIVALITSGTLMPEAQWPATPRPPADDRRTLRLTMLLAGLIAVAGLGLTAFVLFDPATGGIDIATASSGNIAFVMALAGLLIGLPLVIIILGLRKLRRERHVGQR